MDAQLPTESDANLLYDAWAVTVSNYDEFPDTNPQLPLEAKLDKTMDEWIQLSIDRLYRYHDLFQDAFSVKNYLLCVIGTGYGWNERGFIAPIGPSGIDTTIFSGYTRAEDNVLRQVKARIRRLRDHPLIRDAAHEYLQKTQDYAQRIYNGEDWLDVVRGKDEEHERTLKELKDLGIDITKRRAPKTPKRRTYYPLGEYSNIIRMPPNAHPSYVAAGMQIAQDIIQNPAERKESKKYARAFLGQK
ncbi:hypothetical protein HY639_05490 [Candidatus Woesearchaeota archaeon]|nr:hypothetical protein [Candidatus Woesearchaeota archaeon]